MPFETELWHVLLAVDRGRGDLFAPAVLGSHVLVETATVEGPCGLPYSAHFVLIRLAGRLLLYSQIRGLLGRPREPGRGSRLKPSQPQTIARSITETVRTPGHFLCYKRPAPIPIGVVGWKNRKLEAGSNIILFNKRQRARVIPTMGKGGE